MLVPYSWLKELVPGLPGVTELEPVLARLGLPIDDQYEVAAPPPGVVFGVATSARELEGTALRVLQVDVGGRSVVIVTGAPNARAGIGLAIALPGAVLPADQDRDTDGLGLEVASRVIQGVQSEGMACSPKELRLGEYGGGLLELPAGDAQPGTPLAELWPGDHVLDVEITPNRADALSVLGLARDLAAALSLEVVEPSEEAASEHHPAFPVPVEIEDTAGCDYFVARAARGVTAGPSPAWLQRRLNLCGMRPINTLVDASNYVMLELGQPTAAYDWADLPENRIVVRAAKPGEVTVTLDDVERELNPSDLVIGTPTPDGPRVIGLAGVMGAKYSSISESTRDVVLEAAHFDPVRLRLTARRQGLATDAVYRFERGVDPALPGRAADRYIGLVASVAGGTPVPGRYEAGKRADRARVAFAPGRVNRLLGTSFSDEEVRGALERANCLIEPGEAGSWTVRPPTYRIDLEIEEDLVEEVARLLGYDNVPETLPVVAPPNSDVRGVETGLRAKRVMQDVLAGLGFEEIVSYSFTSIGEAERARAPIPRLLLRNPQTSERTAMRAALYPSLLNAARVNRAQGSLKLFEIGHVFPAPDREEERLGLLMAGPLVPRGWSDAGLPGGFYALKGLLEAAAKRLGDRLEVRPLDEAPSHLHPGIAGEIHWNGFSVGEIGALHPQVSTSLELPADTIIAELQLPLPGRPWTFMDPSRHPRALRDLAIIAPREVPYARLEQIARDAAGLLLESVEPFDVYAGQPIPEGQRSVAVHLSFRAPGRTLTDAEVDAAMTSVIAAVRSAGYAIRD